MNVIMSHSLHTAEVTFGNITVFHSLKMSYAVDLLFFTPFCNAFYISLFAFFQIRWKNFSCRDNFTQLFDGNSYIKLSDEEDQHSVFETVESGLTC